MPSVSGARYGCGDGGGLGAALSLVPTAPVSAVPALFATVRARPPRFVPSKPPPAPLEAVLTGRNGPGRARTVANGAGTALTRGGKIQRVRREGGMSK